MEKKFESFYITGSIFQISHYQNNVKNGSHEEFFENRKLKMCGNYYKGFKIGEFEEYFKSGGKAIYNY
jgi:antitoxin component YwqK of YwqJK toxin-antitoxin module